MWIKSWNVAHHASNSVRRVLAALGVWALAVCGSGCGDDSAPVDPDPPVCGNGIVEVGETCDGTCVSTCDDGDVCTVDLLTGDAETCDAACGVVDVVWCDPNDGCCPAGCDANTDADCAPVCGNGVIEGDEVCDGADRPVLLCQDLVAGTVGELGPCAADCHFADGLPSCCADDVWVTESIDGTGISLGNSMSMVLDATGMPSWSSYDGSASVLRYTHWNGSAWTHETIDASDNPGGQSSLAMDVGGGVHVVYYNWSADELKYARRQGGQWLVEVVDDTAAWGDWPDLALDGAGLPHIVYYDETNGDLKYAQHDGSQWTVEVVDSTGMVGSFASLVLDASDRPHVTYIDDTREWLLYAVRDGAAWSIERVSDVPGVRGPTSLALDSRGRPHVVFTEGVDWHLKYAWWTSVGWGVVSVDESGDGGWDAALALDSADRPHVANLLRINSTSSRLRYSYLTAAGWVSQELGSSSFAGWLTFALDPAGRPHSANRTGMMTGSIRYSRLDCP